MKSGEVVRLLEKPDWWKPILRQSAAERRHLKEWAKTCGFTHVGELRIGNSGCVMTSLDGKVWGYYGYARQMDAV